MSRLIDLSEELTLRVEDSEFSSVLCHLLERLPY